MSPGPLCFQAECDWCSVAQPCQFSALGLILSFLSVSQGCLTRPQISIPLLVPLPPPLLALILINNFYGKAFSSVFLYCETFLNRGHLGASSVPLVLNREAGH